MYKRQVVYSICLIVGNDKVYLGKTTQLVFQRLKEHKRGKGEITANLLHKTFYIRMSQIYRHNRKLLKNKSHRAKEEKES